MRDADDGLIRRYLLGLLPEAEAEALEDEYFARPEILERVRGVEDDLLDDWAAGRLPADDKTALEKRYLGSEALRQRLVAARALRLARPADGGTAAPVRRSTRWTGALSIAAGVVLAVVASWFWSRAPQGSTSTPPTSFAARETPLPPPSPQPTAATSATASPILAPLPVRRLVLALSPTLLRSEGGPAQVRVPPGTDSIVVELQGDASAISSRTPLEAAVETVEGNRVWRGPARRDGRPSLAAVAEIPAARLRPGDYLLTLSAGGETLHRYYLRVSGR